MGFYTKCGTKTIVFSLFLRRVNLQHSGVSFVVNVMAAQQKLLKVLELHESMFHKQVDTWYKYLKQYGDLTGKHPITDKVRTLLFFFLFSIVCVLRHLCL